MAVELSISGGKVTLIDEDDVKSVTKFKWKFNNRGYAVRCIRPGGKWKTIQLHRYLMDAKEGQIVDHINGDRLDNRRENLRFVNRTQNARNRSKNKDSKSIYKCVTTDKRHPGRYTAFITVKDKKTHLGIFDNPHDAARMYNFWANDLYGKYARLNEIKEAL